ncbi:PadR family transcriptional regulator [Desulfosporosinus meridiei]|uniref:Putative transcriptional regulator n=1 Tax=Desulfosporosinus meridiei (strain ATCC BAA-275 / DSM 13257 / KCTC 12902 / NCIMB 13706 / S10) TaxID=768704 RepID=J7ISQ8_DESMD|nr:PadR family transcriptional regulator [Desulfosporosinus meridiei]AFQ44892.1 putative transcriptional regulator [Desulfosporosinus meridiei DSM 13257]
MIPLLILGLLIQNPGSNGYELLAQMDERHYKYIVNFTKGSFYYNLQQLEEKKLIKQVIQSEQSRESHHYVITEIGKAEFEKLMYQFGTKTEYVNLSFYAALLFAKEYKSDNMIKLIKTQIEQTEVKIRLLKDALEGEHQLPIHFSKMLENSVSHHLVNLEWFTSLLKDVDCL